MNDNVTKLNKKKTHATKSFDQMVADSQLARLKPYIQEQVSLVAQQITQSVYQFVMQERAAMQTRQLAFERLLKANAPWFSEEVLALEVAAVEDEAAGYVTADVVAVGDKVRCEFSAQASNAAAWGREATKLAIHSVGNKGPNGNVQTHPALEEALLGMRVGETREFRVEEPAQEGAPAEFSDCKVTVARISRAKEAQ